MSCTPGEGPGEGRTGGAPSPSETPAVAVPCAHPRRSLAALAALAVLAGPWNAVAQDLQAPPPAAERPPAPAPEPEPAPEPGPEPAPPADEPLVPPVPPPAVPVPDPSPPRPEDVFSGRPPKDGGDARADEERSWFDSSHDAVGRIFFAPAVRIDRFFSDETELDPERAESFARLRTGVRLREDGKPDYAVDVLADIRLPGVNRWLDRTRLVLTGATDPETTPLDGSPSTAVTARERTTPNLELRFGAYRGIRSSIDLGAGVLFRLPIGAFTRVRYRLAVPIEDRLLGRFSTQVFWRTDLHLGTRFTAGLEWPATSSSLVRLGGAAQLAQRRTRGIEYGTELVYSYAFTRRSAIALGTDTRGNTDVAVAFEKYRLYTRFRQDLVRRWLFLEVEPEIGWPWTEDRGRYRAYAVSFRFEVQFEGDRAVEDTR